ncbi:hypothetical protein [Halorussus salinisoli]|uniref:hypothetical protein n=1 Tax=Halorussus salinisoli TaxID=2558242 RepID=UPI0010C1B23C|nr:hypothetical protein [Halorussus salinisoli]
MTSKNRTLSVVLVGVLLLSSVAAAGMGSAAAETTANESLTVAVEQADDHSATVTVTQNDSTVENASVTVDTTDDNDTYAGAGDYETDENGTVYLPAPEENVTVAVTAEKDNATGAATATLTASAEDAEEGSFGDLVSSFVHEMLNAGDDGGPIGQAVSEFVTSNNPGNASEKKPDHAGKPADAGNSGNATTENGTDEGGSQGPPEHAGNDEEGDDEEGDDEKGNSNNGNGKGH